MRNKFLQVTLLLLSSLIIIGCSTSSSPQVDAKSADYIQFSHEIPLKKVSKLIMQAGKEDGWRMTQFKESTVIAEKIGDESAQAVTVNFSQTSFNLAPYNSDLANAIEAKLNGMK